MLALRDPNQLASVRGPHVKQGRFPQDGGYALGHFSRRLCLNALRFRFRQFKGYFLDGRFR